MKRLYPPTIHLAHVQRKLGGSEDEVQKDDRETVARVRRTGSFGLVSESRGAGQCLSSLRLLRDSETHILLLYKRWASEGKALTSLYDLPRTPKSHKADMNLETVSFIVQLRLGLGYGEDALAYVLQRDYGITVSHHGVGNVLKRAGLLVPRKKRVRVGRQLSDRQYYPGEVGQMDVKHWRHAAYQYDIVDCATRIKYKRLYPGVNPAYTVNFLEHAVRFFAPAFTFTGIQTDNGTEFSYDHLPHVKPETKAAPEIWLAKHGITHLRIPAHSPHLNGRIERSHGVDKDRYKRLTTNSYVKAELQEFCVEDCLDYNFYRPHSMLHMLTPVEYLQSLDGFANATLDTSVLVV